jgi:polar amino acid transport system substrate-binding protein
LLLGLAAPPGRAQPLEAYPKTWGGRVVGPEVPSEIRFLTDDDYPPFNYIDEDGKLTGFNIDMARAICSALSLVCTVEPRPWVELIPALEAGEADAIIASLAATEDNRSRLAFTDGYYRSPARFVVRSDSDLEALTPGGLAGRRVGVLQDTAHEAYLRDFFADSVIVTFENHADAQGALRFGKIDALFGDGVSLMFWLNGASSRRCCVFRGGAYTEARYFGDAVGIAVAADRSKLAALLSQGIALAKASGEYEELLLRYFPMSLY